MQKRRGLALSAADMQNFRRTRFKHAERFEVGIDRERVGFQRSAKEVRPRKVANVPRNGKEKSAKVGARRFAAKRNADVGVHTVAAGRNLLSLAVDEHKRVLPIRAEHLPYPAQGKPRTARVAFQRPLAFQCAGVGKCTACWIDQRPIANSQYRRRRAGHNSRHPGLQQSHSDKRAVCITAAYKDRNSLRETGLGGDRGG
ncbi:hypothetical protein SDC9_63529 [bioreactor metagenome]|uniref:Uncharacterized protein n=1 Tax=bioreactor metagenome TaxID=1076179 RepID=A0A644XSN4_9ZZZZ